MKRLKEGTEVIVTGGCGFIGSHVVDELMNRGCRVTVIDNLSAGTTEYLEKYNGDERLVFVEGDIRNGDVLHRAIPGKTAVIHLAAQPDVRLSATQPLLDFEINVAATLGILDEMRLAGVPLLIFASSAGTIYGDTEVLPTPESHPLQPISHYGASKAACEMYLSSYAAMSGMRCVALRYGNIFGPRSTHGVMHDFFNKLRQDPSRLEILGDGMQQKSYLYVSDCVRASLLAGDSCDQGMTAFNVSTAESLTVKEIAATMIDELGLSGVSMEYTGGTKGWAGDVTRTLADTSRIRALGWKPEYTTLEGVRLYTRWLMERYGRIAG
ncbi:MAG: NAD-dependent epimerase/dehydratase family protein [bacterium]|nr:NAD-dependent epimerase/dehydratase family protein [bacterium]